MASRKLWMDVDMDVIRTVLCQITRNPNDVFSEPRCKEFGIPTSISRRLKRKHVLHSGKKILGAHATDLIADIAAELPIDAGAWEKSQKILENGLKSVRLPPHSFPSSDASVKRVRTLMSKKIAEVLTPAICKVLEMEIETLENMVRRRKEWWLGER